MRLFAGFLLFFIIFSFVSEIFPQDLTEQAVTEIRFEGLKKTKESYMKAVLERFSKVPSSSLDLHEVETALEELRLFSEIKVTLEKDENGNSFLNIKVKEKFSFLPIPFLMYSSDQGFMGGAFVMDTNAFGIRDNYLVGGVFSKNIQMALMAYSRPSLDAAHPGFSVGGAFTHRDREEKNSRDEKMLEYDTMGGSVNVSVSDKITKRSKILVGLGYNYTHIDFDKKYSEYKEKLRSFHAVTLEGGWNFTVPELNEWFMSEKSVRIGGDVTFLTTGARARSFDAEITIQQPLPVTRLRVLTHYAGYYSKYLPLALLPSQMVVGTTIMPEKFHSAKMAGIDLGLEVGIYKMKYFVISAYGLLEQFLGEDFGGSPVMDFGYSTGIKVYLKNFAFPAISVGVSHDITQNSLKFSAAIGVGGF